MKRTRGITFTAPDPGRMIPMGLLPAYQAARDPDAPAFTIDGRSTSRAEFEARANRRARVLAQQGVGHNDVVINALPNGSEFFETSFAIWKLGATVCHVNHRLPDTELGAIATLAAPKLVVGPDPSRLPGVRCLPADLPLDETLSADPLPGLVAERWKIATSGGSTGRPKLIADRMGSVWDPQLTTLGIIAGETVLNPAPLFHNAPFGITHIALFTGCHVVDMRRFEPMRLLKLVEQYRVSWLYLVPTMMHRIWRLPEADRLRADVSSLELVIHMASICPLWLKEKWIDWLGPDVIWELYGGTETLGATVINGRDWLTHKGSVGKLAMGQGLTILSETGETCAPGEVGEIYFRVGEQAPYSYIGAEPRAQAALQSFGDVGYLDAEGYLYVVDRRTDLIVTGGSNVYPAEVEAALDSHPAVLSSIVIGLPDEDLVHRVHALVEVAPDRTVTPTELQTFLHEHIAHYKVPKTFEFVQTSLRDDAGKARRSALRAERMKVS